ncbi:hypothetical protein EZI54_06165 [Marinobacter halodurans]|uniref:Uncharacterized protein n=1 Tax=Marinobacter halodurans TaxID=2528979 RepID=A0ABY1ZRB9_9GAMM|nr:hypothetical protein [Marinobacter halodurans]TBW57623.1 hypothetical protein EZI54_06165 [Marinobacter halodurans]
MYWLTIPVNPDRWRPFEFFPHPAVQRIVLQCPVLLHEKSLEPKPLGGGVLPSVPVLAIPREYGI